MPIPSLKVLLVAYIVVAMGSLLWQLHSEAYFADCEFNAGACRAALKDHGVTALTWPSKMFVLRAL